MSNLEPTLIADGLIFPESLRWHDGALWFADMYDGKLFRHRAGSDPECILAHDGYLGGCDWIADRMLRIVAKRDRAVLDASGNVVARIDGATTPLNDAIALPDGRLLIGEYGFELLQGAKPAPGCIWSVSVEGDVALAAEGLAFPNGMAVRDGGQTLLVAESMANRITRFTIGADGKFDKGTAFAEIERLGPDGVTMAPDGLLWVAARGLHAAVALNQDGAIIRQIAMPSPIADLCLDGDGTALFVGLSDAKPRDLSSDPMPRTGRVLRYRIH